VDEDNEAIGVRLGQEEVVAPVGAVGQVEPRLALRRHRLAPCGGHLGPETSQRLAARHVGGVVEGVRPVDETVDHAPPVRMNIGPPRQRGKAKPFTMTTSMASA
jgi:hypothetical protein